MCLQQTHKGKLRLSFIVLNNHFRHSFVWYAQSVIHTLCQFSSTLVFVQVRVYVCVFLQRFTPCSIWWGAWVWARSGRHWRRRPCMSCWEQSNPLLCVTAMPQTMWVCVRSEAGGGLGGGGGFKNVCVCVWRGVSNCPEFPAGAQVVLSQPFTVQTDGTDRRGDSHLLCAWVRGPPSVPMLMRRARTTSRSVTARSPALHVRQTNQSAYQHLKDSLSPPFIHPSLCCPHQKTTTTILFCKRADNLAIHGALIAEGQGQGCVLLPAFWGEKAPWPCLFSVHTGSSVAAQELRVFLVFPGPLCNQLGVILRKPIWPPESQTSLALSLSPRLWEKDLRVTRSHPGVVTLVTGLSY